MIGILDLKMQQTVHESHQHMLIFYLIIHKN